MITINGRTIGPGRPVYLVAEMSANHHQSFDVAVEILAAAKEAGADAVKLQTYTPDTMTIDSHLEPFQIRGTPWNGRTLYELYGEACTPWEWHSELKDKAAGLDLDLFSTPFDDTAIDFLESLDFPAHKIASFENGDLSLLRHVGKTGKPVIMSTGMSTLEEIDEAVGTLRKSGTCHLALLKCTSAYPAPPEAINLRAIPHLAATFGVPVGLSDHTLGTTVPVAAVALGACIIEKHFTLSRAVPGPDSAFSLEPHEFAQMVEAVRTAEAAMGSVEYGIGKTEMDSHVFRRSLFAVEDVTAGEPFTEENVRSIRPGHGLHPRHRDEILGKPARRNVARGTPLGWDLIGAPDQ